MGAVLSDIKKENSRGTRSGQGQQRGYSRKQKAQAYLCYMQANCICDEPALLSCSGDLQFHSTEPVATMQNAPATSEKTTVWDTAVLSEFAKGDADVFVFNRQPMEGLGPIVDSGRVHEYQAPVSREKAGFEIRGGLRELRLTSRELEVDLINLVNSFLNQFELEEAKLRIEIVRTRSCPKFHCDNVNVRMVTTYVGPCTEYQHSGESAIHTAPVGGLVFLKGHQNPTYRDTVHHRSPAVSPDERRLFVAIDF